MSEAAQQKQQSNGDGGRDAKRAAAIEAARRLNADIQKNESLVRLSEGTDTLLVLSREQMEVLGLVDFLKEAGAETGPLAAFVGGVCNRSPALDGLARDQVLRGLANSNQVTIRQSPFEELKEKGGWGSGILNFITGKKQPAGSEKQ